MISTAMSALNVTEDDKHACDLEVTFSSAVQAEQAKQIMQVDQEPTDRVTKSFILKTTDNVTCLVVRFESKEVKMLRVAVSSFTGYLQIVLKTMQEFDAVE